MLGRPLHSTKRSLARRLVGGSCLGGFAVLMWACAQGGGPVAFEDESPAPPTTAQGETEPGPRLPQGGGNGGTDSGDEGGGSLLDSGGGGGSDAGGSDGGRTDSGTGSDASADAGASDSGADTGGGTDAGACATVPPNRLCKVVSPQCGCGATQTCDVTNLTTGATSCVNAGAGTLGSACASTNQCAKELTCLFGACRPYCPTAGAACAGANVGSCFEPETGAGGATTPNLKVCAVTCDPRNPAARCGSNGCVWFSTDKESDCRPVGTKKLYDACASIVECAPGLTCATHPLFGPECERWCRVGQGGDCGLLEDCVDVYGANAPTVGAYKYGLCR